MHYVTLFGYWRRAQQMLDDERQATEDIRAQQAGLGVSHEDISEYFPPTREWGGGE